MGAVTLRVGNLDAMTAYYRDAVALQVLDQTEDTVTLGRGLQRVIVLEHAPELKYASPSAAGLFHTAILFDTEEALAAVVYSVTQKYPGSFTGSSDHLMSKAFYFTDPEGNGVELYWDRDRSAWSWAHSAPQMGSLYLDPNGFLQENLSPEAMADPLIGGATVGHVHLQVGDIETARQFYVTILGFETTVEMPGSALFVSAGGYHHHMGMNVWNSKGAGPRIPALGLGRVDIAVPGADDVGALLERAKQHGIPARDDGRSVSFDDPWGSVITVTPSAA